MAVWTKELGDGIWLVGVSGRLDQGQTPNLEEKATAMLEAGSSRLVVDLAEVTYVNSGGLRCLVTLWRKARSQGGDVALCGLNERIGEVVATVGFDKVFQIFRTAEAAEEALK
jgi:anti-sigma B factor antagonist